MDNLGNYKRIMIIGDPGRGKSTFAIKIAEKTSLPIFEIDDVYWEIKYTKKRNQEESLKMAREIYAKDKWIAEGATRSLIIEGLEKAEIIYYLAFEFMIPQYYYLFKREMTRKNIFSLNFWNLVKHVTKLRYNKNYKIDIPRYPELVKPYSDKVIQFNSVKEISNYIEKF